MEERVGRTLYAGRRLTRSNGGRESPNGPKINVAPAPSGLFHVKIEVRSRQRTVYERLLLEFGGRTNVVSNDPKEHAYFQVRRLDVIENSLGKRTVLTVPVHRDFAIPRCVSHQRSNTRLDSREPRLSEREAVV